MEDNSNDSGDESNNKNTDVDDDDNSEVELPKKSKRMRSPLHFDVGDYVVLKYEAKLYPGKVMIVKKEGAEVSSMVPSGSNWKWPNLNDQIFYYHDDITGVIAWPTQIGKRGIYRVLEMSCFQ
jgi:hypothetical protein